MGLVKCRDCGRMVSDRVDFCPHCGGPMREGVKQPVPPTPRRPRVEPPAPQQPQPQPQQPVYEPQPQGGGSGVKAFIVSFLVVILIGCGAMAYYHFVYLSGDDNQFVTSRLRSTANSFDELGEFYDGVAQVKRGGHYYYIDTQGNIVDRPDGKHNGVHVPDDNGLLRVENGGRYGYVDAVTRDTVIPAIYSTLGSFYNGFALASIKYGVEGMPEYKCYQGYVDIKGHDTFLPEHFDAIYKAQADAERRHQLDMVPKGVSLRAVGLPSGVSSVKITRDSLKAWTLGFGTDGILNRYSSHTRGQVPRSYRVVDGHVSDMSFESGGAIHRYVYRRERNVENRETIYKIGENTRENVGYVVYSPDDGSTIAWGFEQLPALDRAYTDSTDISGRAVVKRLADGTTILLNYY